MTVTDSLVSCLMVSSADPDRADLIRHSIACYCRQTYQPRELVIVLDRTGARGEADLRDHLRSLGRNDIRMVVLDAELPLGALRNFSVREARGSVLCQWDDDDLHHPERIAAQLKALHDSGSEAVCLQEAMHFFRDSRTLYWANWRATEQGAHPGTILWRREPGALYPEIGPSARLGEDTVFALQFRARNRFHALAGAPHLYVYVHHGANAWSDAHHRMVATKLGISQALLRRREVTLRQGLAAFDFGPGTIAVEGYNGPAFTLDQRAEERVRAPHSGDRDR